jgi:hypothetical protein
MATAFGSIVDYRLLRRAVSDGMAAGWALATHWIGPTRGIAGPRSSSGVATGFTGREAIRWRRIAGALVLAYVGSAAACDQRCRTGLYDIRQVRLALGKDMSRVQTLLLLNGQPEAEFRRWLGAEHPTMTVGVADPATQAALLDAFRQPGQVGDWLYVLDPLGNLLMRYKIDVEPRGLLKDLQRLLKWSKIG